MTSDQDPLLYATDTPTKELVDRLRTELTKAGTLADLWSRVSAADQIRYCEWEGQSEDGKKHKRAGKDPFPWEGAADCRPMVVDDVINEGVDLCTTAFARALAGGKMADDEAGAYAVALLDYLVNTRLTDRLRDEVELAAQYFHTYGWVVLHTCWEQRIGLRRRDVTLDDLAAYGQMTGTATDWPSLMADPSREDEALAVLRMAYDGYAAAEVAETTLDVPPVSDKTLRRALRDLREKGATNVPVPYVCKNEPAVYALRPWVEVVIPPDTTDLQAGRVVFQREYLTEQDLRARILTDGYSRPWVDEAAKQIKRMSTQATRIGTRVVLSPDSTPQDFIEVVHATYRTLDEDGVPVIYMTTFNPSVQADNRGNALVARHTPIDYTHGDYPYVMGKREHLARGALLSRGVSEIAMTWQLEEKALRDSTIDWTSMGVIPPVNVYQDPQVLKYKIAPAVQNLVRVGREPQFMSVPTSGVPICLDAQDRAEKRRCGYFGVAHPEIPPERTQMRSARVVQRFLGMWVAALRQVMALCQQYMPDAEFSRVTGAPQGWLKARRQDPAVLTAALAFDVRELSEELTLKRLEVVNKAILPTDVQGTIDRTKWVQLQLRAVNPAWSRELVQPAQAASQALFTQVRDDIAQMFLGNPPQMVENDPTAQTKLQFAQQIVQANPYYLQALQQGGRFAELMQAYAKNLGFSATQEQNKMIGRIGVSPAETQGQA